jgi:hypothetical protein
MLETVFGPTLTLSTGKVIPTRWVGEQHVKEDLGFIPSFADWMRAIRPLPWMGRAGRLEERPDQAPAPQDGSTQPRYPSASGGIPPWPPEE